MEAFGEAGQGEFGGDIRKEMRHAKLSPDGGDIDDRRALPVLAKSAQHVGNDGLNCLESTEKVDVHRALKSFECLIFKGPDLDDGGVVDQDIDPAKAMVRRIHKRLHLDRAGEVGGHKQNIVRGGYGSALDQERACLLKFGGVARGENQLRAGTGKALRHGKPETA